MAPAKGLLCFAVLCLAVSSGLAAETPDSGDDRVGRSNFWSQFADGFRAIEQQAQSHLEQAMGGLVRRMSSGFPAPAVGVKKAGDAVDDYDDDDDDDDDSVADTSGTASAVAGVSHGDIDSAFGDLSHFASSLSNGFGSGTVNVFGGFGGFFGQAPWWKGPNVCIERKEEVDTPEDEKNKPTPSPETSTKPDSEETTAATERDREALEDDDDEEPSEKPARLSSSFASYRLSSCQETANKHECKTTIRDNGVTKTYIVRHRCCPGSRRVAGQPGCVKVEMRTVLETASAQGAALFTKLVESTGLSRNFGDDANVTLFAPTDTAFRDYTESVMEQNDVSRIRRAVPESRENNEIPEGRSMDPKTLESAELVMAHIVPGQFEVSELHRDQVLHTADDNSTIRINKYFGVTRPTVVTANCARVTSADNPSTNGIVHIVDRVLRPVPRDTTLATIIEMDPEFSTLRTLLERTGLMDKLREEGPFTVFAPTNKAFEEMEEKSKANLMGGVCDEIVLKHHILGLTVCSAVVQGRIQAANLNGNFVSLSEDEGKIFLNDVEITSKDRMGSNGVLHVVDRVYVPDSARPLSGMLDSKNLTLWRDIMKRVDLLDTIDNDTNYTMIVPTPKALEQIEELISSDDAEANKKLRDIVLYHIVRPAVPSCELKNGRDLKSELDGKNIRINLYNGPYLDTQGTLQCSRIVASDGSTCGGRVYLVDKVMTPAVGSVADILADKKYSQFLSLIEVAGLTSKLSEDGPLTVLAPSNKAFDDVSPNNVKKLMGDKELAAQVVKRHMIPASLCCAGVSSFAWPFTSSVRTLSEQSAPLRRIQGKVHIGETTVTECDTMASNGIVHEVDKLMLPIDMPFNRQTIIFNSQQNPNTDIVLYGL